MSSLLPSPNDDYAAPADMRLNRVAWDAALVSVGTRLRALEAVKADFEALIALGTSQALAVISENVEPQLAALTAALTALQQAIAEAEDTILQIITGSVPASAVSETSTRIWLTPALRDAWNAKQAGSAKLSAFVALTLATNQLVYATGEESFATTGLSELARDLLGSASGEAMRSAIGAADADAVSTEIGTLLPKSLAAFSIPGRAGSGTGNMAAITAGANDRLLARVSDAIAFVQLTLGMVPDGLLTSAKLAAGVVRERLTADRTYYVRTNGSNSNNGLADTSGGAFLTIQKALDVVAALDLNGYDVTIRVANGTYAGFSLIAPFIGTGDVAIIGNTGSPSSVVINSSSSIENGAVLFIEGVRFTTTSGVAINVQANASLFLSTIQFGTVASFGAYVSAGAKLVFYGNYAIVGNCSTHLAVAGGAVTYESITVTLTGTPSLGTFIYCSRLGSVTIDQATMAGSATGSRYNIDTNSVIFTGGKGASFLPGSTAGSVSSGGQYV
jgi:hypothetical protein